MNCFVIGTRQEVQQNRIVTLPFACSAVSGFSDEAGWVHDGIGRASNEHSVTQDAVGW